MRDPASVRADVLGRTVLFGGVVVAMAGACNGDRQEQQEPEQPQQLVAGQPCIPAGDSFGGSSRGAVVAWAGGLSYQPMDASRAFVYGFAPDDSVRIEAAVLDTTGPGGASPYGCLYARITSERAFPALGIGPGQNYLWADSVGGADRSIVIPADSSLPMTVHPLVLHSHTADSTPPASVGAYGSCGQCMRYWCRATLDSAATAARMAEPSEVARLRGGDLRR